MTVLCGDGGWKKVLSFTHSIPLPMCVFVHLYTCGRASVYVCVCIQACKAYACPRRSSLFTFTAFLGALSVAPKQHRPSFLQMRVLFLSFKS